MGNNEGEFIFIFHSAHDAIMGERTLLVSGLDVRVMPVPSYIGKTCGIALRIGSEELAKAQGLLDKSVKGIYRRSPESAERFVPWNP
jgi:hypothetical protein